MKFEELKKSFSNGFKSAYLLDGFDEYLLVTSLNLIIKYSGVTIPELNIIVFSEGIIDCNDVVKALDTMPIMNDKKIVHLDLRLTKKSELKNVALLNQYLKNPNSMSILVITKGQNEEDFGIDKKLLEVVDCSRLDSKIIKAKIEATLNSFGKKISADAMETLMQYTLCDLSKILIECNKLVSYVGDREEIVNEDVKNIVTASIEYQIFDLTDALAKKNSIRAYSILDDMQSRKDEYKMLPALIYNHFRRLFQISLNKGTSTFELAKLLGVKEYAVKMSLNQIKLFSVSSLKKINEFCANLDFDLKQSNISLENAIDLMVLTILNI